LLKERKKAIPVTGPGDAADALGTLSCKPSYFRKIVRKVIHQVK
jgi:hypothetical protein